MEDSILAKKIVIIGLAVILGSLLILYTIQTPPEQHKLDENPSKFVLEGDDIHNIVDIGKKYNVSSSQFSKIIDNSILKLNDYGYENGFGVRYEKSERGFDLIITKFSTILAAETIFDLISENLEYEMGEHLISKVGREREAFVTEENIYKVIFRESNLLVLIQGEILASEIEMYGGLVEDEIHKSLRK